MVTAALLAFALATGFGAAAAAALLLGIGGGWLNTATNVLVSDIYPDDRGRMLNLARAPSSASAPCSCRSWWR